MESSSCQQAASRLERVGEMGFVQSGKINDIFKNLRVFTTKRKKKFGGDGEGWKRKKFLHQHDIVPATPTRASFA